MDRPPASQQEASLFELPDLVPGGLRVFSNSPKTCMLGYLVFVCRCLQTSVNVTDQYISSQFSSMAFFSDKKQNNS